MREAPWPQSEAIRAHNHVRAACTCERPAHRKPVNTPEIPALSPGPEGTTITAGPGETTTCRPEPGWGQHAAIGIANERGADPPGPGTRCPEPSRVSMLLLESLTNAVLTHPAQGLVAPSRVGSACCCWNR